MKDIPQNFLKYLTKTLSHIGLIHPKRSYILNKYQNRIRSGHTHLKTKYTMRKILLALVLALMAFGTHAQKVEISGNKFTVNGNEIWFNGINIPWVGFGSFGRQDWSEAKWEEQFIRCKENNINLIRIWIHCGGEYDPDINEAGLVTGANSYFWTNVDKIMKLAQKHKMYIMPALFSFDIVKLNYSTGGRWRKWVESKENVQSYIDKILIPLVEKYDNFDYLLGWEICNEPEWMADNNAGNHNYTELIRFHGMMAAAVHKNGKKPVTTGSAGFKWHSPIAESMNNPKYPPPAGHLWAADSLKKYSGEDLAFLDFYQVHWYPWQIPWWEPPYTEKGTADYFEINDRPIIIGETEGSDVDVSDQVDNKPYSFKMTLKDMYENAYKNGYDGVCAWMTLEGDGHGTFQEIITATNPFFENHKYLVDPSLIPVPVKGIAFTQATLSIEVNDDYPLKLQFTPANATNRNVTYSLENNNLTIDENGLIVGKKIGTCKVTATSEDGSYKASCVVTTTEDLPPKPLTLTITKTGNGKVTSNVAGSTVMEGTEVTLTAHDGDGFAFNGWTGDIVANTYSITFTMKRNTNITAKFSEHPGICSDPTPITETNLRLSNLNGSFCYVIDGTIEYVNSWNASSLTINGEEFANQYANGNLPNSINGKFYIHLQTDNNAGIDIKVSSFNEGSGIVTNIDEENEVFSKAYPNPFDDQCIIELSNPKEVKQILILDQLGSPIETISETISNKVSFGSDLASGLYYIVIQTKDSIKTIKALKK